MKTITIEKGDRFQVVGQRAIITIDTYYYFEGAMALAKTLEEQTGIHWDSIGCFMDTCAFRCSAEDYKKLPDKFNLTYNYTDPNEKKQQDQTSQR